MEYNKMVMFISCFVLLISLVLILLIVEIRKKSMHIWLWSLIKSRVDEPKDGESIHIMMAFCDHYEPMWGNATYDQEVARVDRWCKDYPIMAAKHKDADGCFPKHSFFYPEEEYREEHLSKITQLCADGYGEIEMHLHHDDDTPKEFSRKVSGFLKTLDENHHVVTRDPNTQKFTFAFVHGDWALDNSRRDGTCCGINNELSLLSELGCYADFTLPSAPSDTQTKKINSIYYAKGVDGQSKSHNTGIDVEARKEAAEGLMIIQGPLCLNWKNRKFGILPRIENSDIRFDSPPTKHRVDLWVKCGIQVKKQPQWRFVKIHTHGTQEIDMDTLLGNPISEMYDHFEANYNDGKKYILHYVSAREMYNIVKAAERGEQGNPNDYRDSTLPRPPFLK